MALLKGTGQTLKPKWEKPRVLKGMTDVGWGMGGGGWDNDQLKWKRPQKRERGGEVQGTGF